MKFYRYWAVGTAKVADFNQPIRCYGGSSTSLEEAQRNAAEAARRTAHALQRGAVRGEYDYLHRPAREEVIQTYPPDGEPIAVVTRNSYGSLVLNAARTLFADIDYVPPGCLASLLGLSKRKSADDQVIKRVKTIADSRSLGLRLYRTANGFRVLAASREFDPLSAETEDLLSQLGSDRLYTRLCRSQESFRARLTPKHWRCGVERPPSRIPWENASQERAYRDWEAVYEKHCADYSTCAEIGWFGPTQVEPAVDLVMQIHDQFACRGSLPLA